MKKIYVILTVAALAVCATSCGNKKKSKEAEPVAEPAKTETVVVKEAPKAEAAATEATATEADKTVEQTVKDAANDAAKDVAKTAIQAGADKAKEAIKSK